MKKKLLLLTGLFALLYGFPVNAQYSWTQKASLTAMNGRYYATGFSIGHYGYIGLGQSASGSDDDFWRWDQKTNTWSSIASYPGAGRYGATSFAIAGNGYTCLGWTGSVNATDLWEYDTTSNSWTQKANFPGGGRYGAFAFVIGTKAYVGCGEPNGPPYFEDVWEYDAVANTWTQLANFPGGERAGLAYFTLNGKGYAGCGWDYSADHKDMWQYDTTSNSWTSVASLPVTTTGVDAPVSFVLDTLAYVGTGYNAPSNERYRDFWSYSAATNTWTPIETLPGVGRWLGVGFSIGNKGYIGTGWDSVSDELEDFWQYGPTSSEGINELSPSVNISLFPNPSKGLINLTYNGDIQKGEILITDLMGRVLDSHEIIGSRGQITLNETALSDGMYFYQVIDSGKLISSGKFIISK